MKVSKKIIIPLVAISIAAITAITPVSAWVSASSDGAGATTSKNSRQTMASLSFSDGTGSANYGTTSAYISASSYPGKTVSSSAASVIYGNVVEEFDYWSK